jgi:hypothetical protein
MPEHLAIIAEQSCADVESAPAGIKRLEWVSERKRSLGRIKGFAFVGRHRYRRRVEGRFTQ